MDQNRIVWREGAQLLRRVIDKPIHVLRIEPTRNDVERTDGFGDWWTRRCRFALNSDPTFALNFDPPLVRLQPQTTGVFLARGSLLG